MRQISCLECGQYYKDLTALVDAGGRVYHLGVSYKAVCGLCGARFPIGRNWRMRKVVNGKTQENFLPDTR